MNDDDEKGIGEKIAGGMMVPVKKRSRKQMKEWREHRRRTQIQDRRDNVLWMAEVELAAAASIEDLARVAGLRAEADFLNRFLEERHHLLRNFHDSKEPGSLVMTMSLPDVMRTRS